MAAVEGCLKRRNLFTILGDIRDSGQRAATIVKNMLRVKAGKGWGQVEIEDNGPGMDEATRRRIFEPFFTTKPAGRGTGLGLSVSHFIVTERHDGEMGAFAAAGSGTCFVIRLPKNRTRRTLHH